MTTARAPGDAGVAVVGLAGRFPGAASVDAFWTNLRDGVESVTFFSEGDLLRGGLDPELVADPQYVRARPIIDGIEWFDAGLFGIHPREAALMDPQHRLFLECSLEALERSGHAGDRHRGSVGVFAGAGSSGYLLSHLTGSDEARQIGAVAHIGIGNLPDFLATRVAYKLDLKGPAYSVQCACSTSLVAIHLACQSLLNFECDLALAGGVSLSVPMRVGYMFQDGGILSPDGHCRAFDAAAAGTLFGSGVGVVVLKPLDAAMADGDTIYAVVLGSAVNNDGALKAGYTSPSVSGQAAVIAEAIANAGVDASTIGYVEAHGTGTALGDPVEITALTQAFQRHTDRTGYCGIGSVKSNIGHLDAAAGVSGFIKTVLALHHRMLPPTLHVRQPSPRIDFDASPFYLNTALKTWAAGAGPRRAGVSAFGFGGTNAHVVLEEAPARRRSGPSRSHQLLLVSARTETALEQATTNLAEYLEGSAAEPLADVAYALQVGRRGGEHRAFVVARDAAAAVDALDGGRPQDVGSASRKLTERDVIFLFPGQGAQHPGMGAELYRHEPAFARQVDRACELFAPHLGYDLRPLLCSDDHGGDHDEEGAAQRLREPDCGDAALFTIEHGLAQLWIGWGVRPQAMIGHSLGELVAATLAGVWRLEDAVRIVAARGRRLRAMPRGAMLAVSRTADEIRPLLDSRLSIALVNTPGSCVVAGDAGAVAAIESTLGGQGVDVRRLDTAQAAHSPAVEPMLDELEAIIGRVALTPPRLPFISNVTGRWITPEEATSARYWTRQLRQTVYFADGVSELLKDPRRVFLEVGPGMTLATLTRQNLGRGAAPLIVTTLPDRRERKPAFEHLLATIGRLWLAGIEVDWRTFYQDERRNRVALPTYPFDRQRYWIDPPSPTVIAGRDDTPVRKRPIDDWFLVPSWKQMPLLGSVAAVEPSATWLVFADDGPLGDGLIAAIAAEGRRVVRVRQGRHFDAGPTGDVQIRPEVRGDYAQMLETLRAADMAPQAIAYAWSVRGSRSFGSRDFYSLLYLARALADRGESGAIRLGLVTSGLHSVLGSERLDPYQALAAGAVKVIAQELPSVSSVTIDVESDGAAASPGDIGRDLLRELEMASSGAEVARRGRHRWVRTYEAVDAAILPAESERLQEGGVYLITGGLGGVGLTLAGWLAGAVNARLVLVGRSRRPLPPALEARGRDVLTIRADVTSDDEMRAAVAEAVARFGRIDGAIHAAGVAGGGIIALKTRDAAERVLAPKVRGIEVLARALDRQPLRFLVLCSSLAALAGGVGQVDYCAANAFLDSWAESRDPLAAPFVCSIDWDIWREVGMAVHSSVPDALQAARAEQLRFGITPAEGVEAFRRSLALGLPRLVVSTLALERRLSPGHQAIAPPGLAAPHPRPALQTPFAEPRTPRERQLAGVWQQILGIESIGLHDNFFDLGGDSLTALRLVAQLKADCGLQCAVADFYSAPTIKLLVERLGTDRVSTS